MFEKTDETVELLNDIETEAAPETYSEPLSTSNIPDPVIEDVDYGLFAKASITVENGIVTVVVPFKNGLSAVKVPVPLASAWIIDNLAGPMYSAAKTFKP